MVEVRHLVVKEDVRTHNLKDTILRDTTEEEGLSDLYTPALKRINDTLVGRGIACCDDRYLEPTAILWILGYALALEALQGRNLE
jgi:hypothetical protein